MPKIEVPHVPSTARKEHEDFLGDFLERSEARAAESEGFAYVPPENILIEPHAEGGGILKITAPEKIKGVDAFSQRNAFESQYPGRSLEEYFAYENAVFEHGSKREPFHPEVGGRFALTTVRIYETKEGEFLLLPVLPATSQRFASHAKLAEASLMRGKRFPRADDMLNEARRKSQANFFPEKGDGGLQKTNIISQPTGTWEISFWDRKRRRGTLPHCQVMRDAATGTLEALKIEREPLLVGLDQLSWDLNIPRERGWAYAVVPLARFRETKEGEPLPLERLYLNGKEIRELDELPETYRGLFAKDPEGNTILSEFKMVPPLRAFHELKEGALRLADKEKQALQTLKGKRFEDITERMLGVKKNEARVSVGLPKKEILEGLIANQPPEFQNWVRNYPHREIHFIPDYVLPDGTFVETKLSLLQVKRDRDQLYRMILYRLIQGEDLRIRYYIHDSPTEADPLFPEITYQNIWETLKKS